MPVKIKVKNDAGEEVEQEVFTQDDFNTALEAKIDEVTTSLTEAFDTKLQEATKKEEPKKDDTKKPGEGEIPAWAKELQESVAKLGGTLDTTVKSGYLSPVASGLDADKKQELQSKFDSLTGYPDTSEGQQKRAQDAYLLTTGEKFDAEGVNMQNLNSSGGGKTDVKDNVQASAQDKEIQGALGISAEDAKKYKPEDKK